MYNFFHLLFENLLLISLRALTIFNILGNICEWYEELVARPMVQCGPEFTISYFHVIITLDL